MRRRAWVLPFASAVAIGALGSACGGGGGARAPVPVPAIVSFLFLRLETQ